MRVFALLSGALFLLLSGPVCAEDGHGADGSDYGEPSSSFSFSSDGTPLPGSDSNLDVPSDVRQWFEDYALQRLAEKKKAEGQLPGDSANGGPVVIVEKKIVRRTGGGRNEERRSQTSSIQDGTIYKGIPPSASATVNQTVTPSVIVTNILPNLPSDDKGSEQKEETEGEVALNGKQNERGPKRYSDELTLAAETPLAGKEGNTKGVGGSGFWERMRDLWSQVWTPTHSGGAARQAIGRRLIVTTEEEYADDSGGDSRHPERATAHSSAASLASSESWFGWVGWIVALILLLLVVVKTRKELT